MKGPFRPIPDSKFNKQLNSGRWTVVQTHIDGSTNRKKKLTDGNLHDRERDGQRNRVCTFFMFLLSDFIFSLSFYLSLSFSLPFSFFLYLFLCVSLCLGGIVLANWILIRSEERDKADH